MNGDHVFASQLIRGRVLTRIDHQASATMPDAHLAPASYQLSSNQYHNWKLEQEASLPQEYPFVDMTDETPDQFTARTYLQFLWLPEVRVKVHFTRCYLNTV